jgi:hypothetical protein
VVHRHVTETDKMDEYTRYKNEHKGDHVECDTWLINDQWLIVRFGLFRHDFSRIHH